MRATGPEATTRRIACDVLVRVEDGAYSHVLLPTVLRRSKLQARDRAQVTDLVYGTLRAQRRLDDLLERVSNRPLRRLDPPVRAALRLGALQLVQGVAPHAAVSETVDAAPRRARGYVNATLRALVRLGPAWPEPEDDAVALSYPDWLVERLRADLGATDARRVLLAANDPAALTLRPNPRRTDRVTERAAEHAAKNAAKNGMIDELTAQGASVTRGALLDSALVVRGAGDPAALAVVASGRATPQDQGSQAVVGYLAPTGDDRVLDVAAAPGGKATAIAELLDDDGLVIAADVNAGRLGMVRVAATRLGLSHLVSMVADGRHPPVRAASVDRVLVDAPCSGLGVLRRRAEARWRIDPEAIPGLAQLQLAMVLAAAETVRPGGVLVYAVCTLTAAETRDVASAVVAALPGWSVLDPPGEPWRPWGAGAMLLPFEAETDGMFVLGLRRAGG
jgi:16S rRNA (cytosine967-C5)-methyltransferase